MKTYREGFDVCEVIAAWPEIPSACRTGILALVRAYQCDLSTVEGREALTGRPSREAANLGRSALSGRETDCGQVRFPPHEYTLSRGNSVRSKSRNNQQERRNAK